MSTIYIIIAFHVIAFALFWLLRRRRKAKARNQAKPEPRTGKLHGPILVSANLATAIVCNEIYLLQGNGLPFNESLYSIGQWAPWVGVALALVAALILRWKQPAVLERQRILDQERAEFELRQQSRPAGETDQEQHRVHRTQNDNDPRPQQALKAATPNLEGEDLSTQFVVDGAASTDLEAGLSDGPPLLLRKCPTL